MGRFDSEDGNSENTAAASAVSATEKLRATVEMQVRAVVEEAMARAVAIEDRALAKASQMEQESQIKADAVIHESQERARHVLNSVLLRAEGMRGATETLQTELAKVIGSFRDEIELLTHELKGAKDSFRARPATPLPDQPEPQPFAAPEPSTATEPAPPPEPVPTPEPVAPEPPVIEPEPARPEPATVPPAAAESAPALETAPEPNRPEPQAVQPAPAAAPEPPAPTPTPPATGSPAAPPSDIRARDMIRQQLMRLRDTGRPREDAERYLGRFKQSHDYKEILDEIYAPEQPAHDDPEKGRRGLLRRR